MSRNPLCLLGLLFLSGLASFAPAQSITTLFTGGNGGSSGWVNLFDVNVKTPGGIFITSLDVNCDTYSVPVTLDVYLAPNTYVGNELNSGAWTRVATGFGTTAAAANLPTPVPLATPFLLTPGRHGVAILYTGSGMSYTNGTGANQNYSNNDLDLTLGASVAGFFTGTLFTPRVWNGTIHYRPASGLYANFEADVTIGAAPLKVTFTDKTFTSDPGGVTSWAWDFDGDLKVDATLQNPIHTYPTQNKTVAYDVTLTVTDASHPQSVLTRKGYITVDPPPKADFSASPTFGTVGPGLPPLIVRFTDLSVGATSWAWDLDGDTQVDSTVQNPIFPYVSGGSYSVTLSVAGVGGNDRITKVNFITVVGGTVNTLSAEILQFQFNEVRTNLVFNSASSTQAPALGTVTNAVGTWHADAGRFGFKGNEAGFGCIRGGSLARVDSGWPINLKGSFTIQWWQRLSQPMTTALPYFFGDGTFRCFTNGVAGLNLMFRGTSIGDVQSTRDVQTGMTGRWLHVAIVVDDSAGRAMFFFDGVLDAGSVRTFTPSTFSYTGGSFIVAGSGASNPATDLYDVDDFRLYGNARSAAQILADMRLEIATTSPYDAGCAGPARVPLLMGNSAPSAGRASFGLDLAAAEPNTAAVIVLGAAASRFMAIPLPLSLDFLYGPASGCGLQASLASAQGLVTDAGGRASLPLPIPTGVAGAHVYAQGLVIGTKGAVTAGLDINIGN